MSFHTTIKNLDLPGVFKAAETVRGQRNQNARNALALEQARQSAGFGKAASAETINPSAGRQGSVGLTPETFAQLPAAKQKAARERVDAVGWLAGTVLDAAPKLRPARYRDALEQARSMGIPTDNLPPTYNPGVDALLRQFRGEARSFLGRMGDRNG